jgi:putative colanic acid biosysnthesis UDP-glucose lipid carrier transferase
MSQGYKYLFFIADLLLLNLAIVASFNLFGGRVLSDINAESAYLLVYSNLTWFFLVLISAPYSVTKGWAPSKILKNQVIFIVAHLLVIASLIILFNKDYSLKEVISIYILFIPAYFVYRVSVFYLRNVFTADIEYRNYILIGRNDLATEVRKFYLMNPEMRYRFCGSLDARDGVIDVGGVREFCSSHDVHEIICCLEGARSADLQQLVNFGLDSLTKVRLVFSSPSPQRPLELERFEKLPGRDLATVALDASGNRFIKRSFDIAFSSLFCVTVLSWLVPLVALIIKLDSRGPVFFKQLRNGENNIPFSCMKFRTMVPNMESDVVQATRGDARITRVGAFLRKSSIDELPQFFNVLRGDMSLIGPRPHPVKLNEKFAALISNIMSRHYVKPGITGLAQCMGYRGETSTLADMENRVRLDRYYIENWTFWLDIKIIFLTVISLIRGSDKAY